MQQLEQVRRGGMESNEEEEEGINEDIVVAVNQRKSIDRSNKMNEQNSNKVLERVNNYSLNGAKKKLTFHTTLSKKHKCGKIKYLFDGSI